MRAAQRTCPRTLKGSSLRSERRMRFRSSSMPAGGQGRGQHTKTVGTPDRRGEWPATMVGAACCPPWTAPRHSVELSSPHTELCGHHTGRKDTHRPQLAHSIGCGAAPSFVFKEPILGTDRVQGGERRGLKPAPRSPHGCPPTAPSANASLGPAIDGRAALDNSR